MDASAPRTDLTGRVALVTGGSRGLGREMVLGLAACGADVVIASRKLDRCQEVADQVRRRTGRRALAVRCHVGDWDDLDVLVETTYHEMGRVDVLVNNAGVAPLHPSLTGVTEGLFDKILDVNLKGPFRLSALVGERMAAGSGGSIINVSSLAALRPTPDDVPYAAAKAALHSLTAGFAVALGPRVRVNCLVVGPFLTDIAAAWDVPGFQAHAAAHYPLGRLGEPPEVVGATLFLASDASSYTTGALIPIDGGIGISSPFPT